MGRCVRLFFRGPRLFHRTPCRENKRLAPFTGYSNVTGGPEPPSLHSVLGSLSQRTLCSAPFGALDPQIRELMQMELLKLLEAHRKTIIFVTHSVDEAIFLSDRILVLSARPGRILANISIELPRPRWTDDETIKSSEQFVTYRQQIWRLLKQELQSEWQLQTAPS